VSESFSQMNGLDYVLLILLVGSLVASVARGFTREIIGMVALAAGSLLGLWFHGSVGALVAPYIGQPDLADLIGFGIVFFGVLAVGGAIGHLLSKVWKVTGLSLVDRLAGGMFGLVKGALMGAVIILVMVAFSPTGPPEFVKESKVAPYVMWGTNALAAMAPRELRDVVERNIATLRGLWQQGPGLLPTLPDSGNGPELQDGNGGPQASPSRKPDYRGNGVSKPSPSNARDRAKAQVAREQNL
jgi:membrane protein required for colicin V production